MDARHLSHKLEVITNHHRHSIIVMQEATEKAEASISTEDTREEPNLNGTFAVRRKAAKRTLPWDLAVDELELVSPQQAEDIRATKKPRTEEPFSASTDEAAAEISSHGTVVVSLTASPDVSVDLSPPIFDNDDANAESVTDTQPNAGATGSWTLEEDAQLTSAVANTCKKKWMKEYKIDWVKIAALVPGRTKAQCKSKWNDELDTNTGTVSGRTGRWTEEEDSKLKSAVQRRDDKNWGAIAALVPGRAIGNCRHRWHDVLDPSNDQVTRRTGNWTENEDNKLKDAVKTYDGKNWGAIAALVPGRAIGQCRHRSRVLEPR